MLRRGAKLGKYVVMEELGEGGLSLVYKGRGVHAGVPVALKVPRRRLLTSPRSLQQFVKGGKALIGVVHPNVVKVISVADQDDLPYIVMEYVPGWTLAEEIHEKKQFEISEVVKLIGPIADGLDFVHNRGLIHRDVKPGNIKITRQGRPVLIDFGIVQTDDGTMWDEGHPLGAACYMSPEQTRGERATGRSDQYSLGIVVYEMLTGNVPFASDSPWATMTLQREGTPPFPEEWDDRLRQVMARVLDKEPGKRFESCAQFVSAAAKTRRELTGAARSRAARAPSDDPQVERDSGGGEVSAAPASHVARQQKPAPGDAVAVGARSGEDHRLASRGWFAHWLEVRSAVVPLAVICTALVLAGAITRIAGRNSGSDPPPLAPSPTRAPPATPSATPWPSPTAALTPESTHTPARGKHRESGKGHVAPRPTPTAPPYEP